MVTLDSQKAFDIIHHSILLNKLFKKDINDTAWLVIKDLYQDISSKVKWVGGLSGIAHLLSYERFHCS